MVAPPAEWERMVILGDKKRSMSTKCLTPLRMAVGLCLLQFGRHNRREHERARESELGTKIWSRLGEFCHPFRDDLQMTGREADGHDSVLHVACLVR